MFLGHHNTIYLLVWSYTPVHTPMIILFANISFNKIQCDYICIGQGWANFLYGGPHWKKMLQPRAAHSLQIMTFIQCINNHIFIHIENNFCISHLGMFNAIYTVIVGNFANILSYDF